MATARTLINSFGRMAGWNSITVNLLGRDVEGISQLSYTDSVEKENAYGAGGFPVGRGGGNYTAEVTMTIFLEEMIALRRSLKPGERLTDIAPFDIEVQYEYNNFLYKDRIRNCEFMDDGIEISQNDKFVTRQFTLIASHIEWNIR